MQDVEPRTQLFWFIAQTSLAVVACGMAWMLAYSLYCFAQGAASKRGVDKFTLKGAAALIAILVVGGTSYVLYPLAMMLLLLLRWVFAGSAPTR